MRDDDLERRLETIERQLVALTNSLAKHVFPRLDRLELDAQIDEPVTNQ